jgi:hypothetical protein
MNDKQKDLIFCGTKLGTFKGWDSLDDENFVFYYFVPNDFISTDKTQCSVSLDHINGVLEMYNDSSEEIIKTLQLGVHVVEEVKP